MDRDDDALRTTDAVLVSAKAAEKYTRDEFHGLAPTVHVHSELCPRCRRAINGSVASLLFDADYGTKCPPTGEP